MEKIQIGTKVKRLGIQRLSVGEGAKCRAILLDESPRMKHIAYDNTLKKRIEVDQDMCIKYGLRPSPTFYYLVAKLNTDLNGNVIGDNFTVEYLQLSENLNNEFSDLILEQGIPKSLALTKVKKSVEGKDFSYIKTTPSNMDPCASDKSLSKKIAEVRENEEFINTCWKMIDADTSINRQQYESLLAQNNGTEELPAQKPVPQLAQSSAPAMMQVPDDFAAQNDFGADDDFGAGFDA